MRQKLSGFVILYKKATSFSAKKKKFVAIAVFIIDVVIKVSLK